MKNWIKNNFLARFIKRMHQEQEGTAAVSFILCLPIFLTVIAVVVQLALIANAKIIVTDAAMSAARAGVTSLPQEKNENMRKAAVFMLATVSPIAKSGASEEGQTLYQAMTTLGVKITKTWAQRYAFASEATQVDYQLGDYKHMQAQNLEVTVTYKFKLTVPIAMAVLQPDTDTIGGVQGRYYPISSKVKFQTSHGRATESDEKTGNPAGN